MVSDRIEAEARIAESSSELKRDQVRREERQRSIIAAALIPRG